MAISRTHLLINYPKFHPSLKQALIDIGLSVVENERQPAPQLLSTTLAAIVDFGGSIRRPFASFLWHRHMAAHGVPVIAWNRDAPHNNNLSSWRLSLFDWLRPLDIYATHSLIDTRWKFADTTLFLPNAALTTAYNLGGCPEITLSRLRDISQYKWDVTFFGALDGQRYKEAGERRAFFSALSERLNSLNISCRFIDTTKAALSLAEQTDLIQQSRINLNYGARCDFGGFAPSGLPERCFGIPSCGGFLLTDHRVHNADSFEIGKHIDEFSNLDECVSKICFYLDHFQKTRDMAESCWRHVMLVHTFTSRAQSMRRALLDWHSGRRGLIRGCIDEESLA